MKTALLVALALLVIVPLAAQPAAAHHGGWNCSHLGNAVEVCTARTLQTGYDCFLSHDTPVIREQTYCWIL